LDDLHFKGALISKTHDNARPMVNAMTDDTKLCGESIRCAAHTLNLAVEDIFNDSSLLGVLRQQCRDITTFFNHSSTANADLLREQVASGAKMSKRVHADVRTRWNSSFLMMERLMELQHPVTKVLQSHTKSDVRFLSLGTRDWELLKEVVKLLKPVYDGTTLLSGQQYPTLALVHIVFSCIIQAVTALITETNTNQPSETAKKIGKVLFLLSVSYVPCLGHSSRYQKTLGNPNSFRISCNCLRSSLKKSQSST
jgi:hypothetical protein